MRTYYSKRQAVEAVQITDSTFDSLHPNPEHLPGIVYDPVRRTATVVWSDTKACEAHIGMWLVRDRLNLVVYSDDAFKQEFESAG